MGAWKTRWSMGAVLPVALATAACGADVGEGPPNERTGVVEHQLDPVVSTVPGAGYSEYGRAGPGMDHALGDPDKPTPDPWRRSDEGRSQANPNKPTPDPWHPEEGDPGTGSGSEGSETN